MLHPRATYTAAELARLEAQTDLRFVGFLRDEADQLVPVLLKADRSAAEQRAAIQRLNQSTGSPARPRRAAA